ncbi:FKBP-type peptidyl-prolyl cis-trans isomerase SlyD [Halalkaliarchaeum desulfuricum]|uniref:peptidylprolyl isomerase n=1 Tax=Halalkaliarchaeum desulfuricum TaxID=2055893 RepID=A0A343TI87_9EURY|nr:peptidylprolyl isomerase [Halalkaliarchaeum desulfuricum]AUX08809.1 FKBP-type peptidyl-prolyl cis-trans isomerase SlyD [Halalkaliarchaeum desulfuricum]
MSDEPQAEAADAVDAEESETEAGTEAESAGIGDGDFVRIAYTIRTVDDGTVVDTTDEEVAEEAGIDDEDYEFGPRTIVVGAGHVFPSVEEALSGAEAGDDGSVVVDAAEAFGEYDPDEVRTVAADKIPEDDRYPGAPVTIDGEQGHLETIIGGRARVDFNHPLAGEDLEYDYEIAEIVDDREEQAAGLLGMYLQQTPDVRVETVTEEEEVVVAPDEDEGESDDVDEEEADEDDEEADEDDEEADEDDELAEPETELQEVEKEVLYIEATPAMSMNQQWLFSKQQIAQDLMDRLDLDRVVIEEVIEGGMMGGLGGMMGGAGGAGDVELDPDELAAELGEEIDEDLDEELGEELEGIADDEFDEE